jgi:hypothetical protein
MDPRDALGEGECDRDKNFRLHFKKCPWRSWLWGAYEINKSLKKKNRKNKRKLHIFFGEEQKSCMTELKEL